MSVATLVGLILLVHTTLSASRYDTQSINIIAQHVSDWFETFDKALYTDPLDQEQIYKLWTKGLVYNYYQQFDRHIMEGRFSDAYELIGNNNKILRRMTANAKGGIPNPFQRLYKGSSERFRNLLYPLAVKANWSEISFFNKRQKLSHILSNQENLRQLKDDLSKLITHNLYLIPSTLIATKQYLRNLSVSSPSQTEIEIGITIFQLSVDILTASRGYYPASVIEFLNDTAKYMAAITISSLRQADKVINIIADGAPELLKDFMDTRQKIIDFASLENHTQIECDGAEMLIAALHNINVMTFMKNDGQIIGLFNSSATYLMNQAQLRYTEARCQFAIRLFSEIMLYSKSLDTLHDKKHIIDQKYIKSMMKSITKIIFITGPEIAVLLSELFALTYPELETELSLDMADDIDITFPWNRDSAAGDTDTS